MNIWPPLSPGKPPPRPTGLVPPPRIILTPRNPPLPKCPPPPYPPSFKCSHASPLFGPTSPCTPKFGNHAPNRLSSPDLELCKSYPNPVLNTCPKPPAGVNPDAWREMCQLRVIVNKPERYVFRGEPNGDYSVGIRCIGDDGRRLPAPNPECFEHPDVCRLRCSGTMASPPDASDSPIPSSDELQAQRLREFADKLVDPATGQWRSVSIDENDVNKLLLQPNSWREGFAIGTICNPLRLGAGGSTLPAFVNCTDDYGKVQQLNYDGYTGSYKGKYTGGERMNWFLSKWMEQRAHLHRWAPQRTNSAEITSTSCGWIVFILFCIN